MNTVTYTFYVENNAQVELGLTPTISTMLDIVDGAEVSPLPAISEIGAGFYKFDFTWDATSSSVGYVLKIDTGDLITNNESTRYVTMRIEPTDYIANTAASIKTSADSLEASAETLVNNSNRILDIEHGTWKIQGTELILYAAGFGRAVDTIIARYDLKDEFGNPTAISPYERRLNTLVTLP